MSGLLPDPTKTKLFVSDYIAASRTIVNDCFDVAASSAAFRQVYRVSLATYSILGGLSGPSLVPQLSAARSIAIRIPFLVSVGQSSAAQTELRRFVELIFWTVYFTNHPIEWKSFSSKATSGFSRDQRKPISFAAHRELGFYMDYAAELMQAEPSGLGSNAVSRIRQAVATLNISAHAGQLAQGNYTQPPHDDVSEQELARFAKTHRITFSNCSLLLGAFRRAKFDRLSAVARAYFDWLVGQSVKRSVRAGPFGLQ